MIFADNLRGPEGPVVLEGMGIILVEMNSSPGRITCFSSDGETRKVIAETGRPNGLALDRQGFLWVAESEVPSLIRLSMDGEYEVVLNSYEGEPFLFPNDLAFDSEGFLYMTDSGILAEDFVIDGKVRFDYMDIDYAGRVYRVDTESKNVELLDTGLKFPNGIAFSPSEDLYVNETITGNVYRYNRLADGGFGRREYFGNVHDDITYNSIRGPDGMKFDREGNLYVTVYEQGDITVLDLQGNVKQRIKTEGNKPTNCAFALGEEKLLYVTELSNGTIETIEVDTAGLELYM